MVLQQKIASPGHGILAMDESNATCGKRLDSIGLENTEANRQACSASPDLLLPDVSKGSSEVLWYCKSLCECSSWSRFKSDRRNGHRLCTWWPACSLHFVQQVPVQAYRELLVTTPGLGQYISGAILFEETLYQNTTTGSTMVDELNKQGIVPGV